MAEPVSDGAEVPRTHVLREFGGNAEGVERFEQQVELLFFGFAMHPVQRAHAAQLELARHGHVREDHALLD